MDVMADWAIEIFDTDDGGVAFQPFVPGAQPGDPLHAETGDTVVWSNRTDRDLTLVSTDDPALDQTIAAGGASDFLFVVSTPPRVRYRCVQPPRGHVIEIS
jgi:hypothetical protein